MHHPEIQPLMQRILGRVAVPAMGALLKLYLCGIHRYRFHDLRELRGAYASLLNTGRPVLVCSNHLTMVDSLLIHHAVRSVFGYTLDYRSLSWNVPAIENAHKNWVYRLICYFGKTVPIDRSGSTAHHAEVLGRLRTLLLRGEVVTMFPEGGRSRSGRIDASEVRYGIGRLLQTVSEPVVLCLYVRSDHQETWGFAPPDGDAIQVTWKILEPQSELTGLRGARILSRQVIETLAAMERQHFARRELRVARGTLTC